MQIDFMEQYLQHHMSPNLKELCYFPNFITYPIYPKQS